MDRRNFMRTGLALASGVASARVLGAPPASSQSIKVGLDGEFGLAHSTSAQAIELGFRCAFHEINQAGGVLGQRLELITRDHRSIPARGIRNLREFIAMPDVVAVAGGRFSPVVIEELPLLKEARLPFLAVWSAADVIVDSGMDPNFVFRLSLRDSLAMRAMLVSARVRGMDRVGLLLTNTSWGRSNLAAATATKDRLGDPLHLPGLGTARPASVMGTAWYNWQEKSLVDKYLKLQAAGAQAIVMVANDDEAALLVREIVALPKAMRLPLISHWGITGGEFVRQAGPALQQVDLTVVQTFSFFRADRNKVARFLASAQAVAAIKRVEDIHSPVGVAHAYDMAHVLARALQRSGSTNREALRNALEEVRDVPGLVKHYKAPFTRNRHEALDESNLLLARFREDGVIVPLEKV